MKCSSIAEKIISYEGDQAVLRNERFSNLRIEVVPRYGKTIRIGNSIPIYLGDTAIITTKAKSNVSISVCFYNGFKDLEEVYYESVMVNSKDTFAEKEALYSLKRNAKAYLLNS